VVFSESLLFIPLDAAFAQALELLNPGGYVADHGHLPRAE